MEPKHRGWKEGIITQDLTSAGTSLSGKGPDFKKGDKVRYKRHRVYDEEACWTGEYEWHYLNDDNYNLVRTSRLLIKE